MNFFFFFRLTTTIFLVTKILQCELLSTYQAAHTFKGVGQSDLIFDSDLIRFDSHSIFNEMLWDCISFFMDISLKTWVLWIEIFGYYCLNLSPFTLIYIFLKINMNCDVHASEWLWVSTAIWNDFFISLLIFFYT